MDATIVITTFRRMPMLAEVLEALGPQLPGRAVEVLVIDNCPDASARQTVGSAGHAGVRYVHEPRRRRGRF
jgi:glycosyltransferase involved in cell wall biosynthesis